MLIRQLRLSNFLSFGPEPAAISFGKLNLLIGPNGSGKSNILEAIHLLHAAPKSLVAAIRKGGPVRDWLWKPGGVPTARLEALIDHDRIWDKPGTDLLRYALAFTESGHRFEIVDERIEMEKAKPGKDFFYAYHNDTPVLNIKTPIQGDQYRALQRDQIDPTLSILAQRSDPDQLPELYQLGRSLNGIRVYRHLTFGPGSPARQLQPADQDNRFVDEQGANLAMVLGRLRRDIPTKKRLLEAFRAIFDGAEDFDISTEGGLVQILVEENGMAIPATRLSDGTMRYLTLLAILYDPEPPSLICLDEPELGLHPDLIGKLAEALRWASERTQVIVTTHSVDLINHFTETPECVFVCERHNAQTSVTRLEPEKLKSWLEDYRLGELWTSGYLGGTRW